MCTEFDDWKWQLKNLIQTPAELKRYIALTEEQVQEIQDVSRIYKMGISPYFASIIKLGDSRCPIRKQSLPSYGELMNSLSLCPDPLAESEFSPVKRLVHKYPDRVAIFASNRCFTYCRHCTRKNTVINENSSITDQELTAIFTYIEQNPTITDVLITGGDPFTLTDSQLEKIVSGVRKIPHVCTLRIGTRSVIAAPMRITEELADMLKKYHPVWINIQCNHPEEITPQVEKACDILQSRGIVLGNQSVLLKGINNDKAIMKELLLKLIKIRVRPYYLYQCDLVEGTQHFMTSYKEGMEMIRALWGSIPGYAIPRFIIDAPGKSGKIVVESSNILDVMEDCLVLRDYEGDPVKVTIIDESREKNENRYDF